MTRKKYKETPIAQYTLYINSNGSLISEKSYVSIEEIEHLFKTRKKDYMGFNYLRIILNNAKELIDDTHHQITRLAP